jgi:hypothetical protein
MVPGITELHRIPNGPSAMAHDCISECTPALVGV